MPMSFQVSSLRRGVIDACDSGHNHGNVGREDDFPSAEGTKDVELQSAEGTDKAHTTEDTSVAIDTRAGRANSVAEAALDITKRDEAVCDDNCRETDAALESA